MKSVIRMFFRALRVALGPFMVLGETLTRPKGVSRDALAQKQVDEACRDLTLYQYRTCPFCIKVRHEMRRLSLTVEGRDPQRNDADRGELAAGGGRVKVPCLRVSEANGDSQWLYDSDRIIAFLRQRFADAP